MNSRAVGAWSRHHSYLPIDKDGAATLSTPAPAQSALVHHKQDISNAGFFGLAQVIVSARLPTEAE